MKAACGTRRSAPQAPMLQAAQATSHTSAKKHDSCAVDLKRHWQEWGGLGAGGLVGEGE